MLPASRRRDRNVLFRLSQGEYDSLVAAASWSRLGSLSEFVRMTLMSAVESEGKAPITPSRIEALERRVMSLEKAISSNGATEPVAAGLPADSGPAGGRSSPAPLSNGRHQSEG
jgi:hypothetical protein